MLDGAEKTATSGLEDHLPMYRARVASTGWALAPALRRRADRDELLESPTRGSAPWLGPQITLVLAESRRPRGPREHPAVDP